MPEADVSKEGLERIFVYTTAAYLLHGRRVDVEMGAESVERIPSILLRCLVFGE